MDSIPANIEFAVERSISKEALRSHLASWGLRRFDSDAEYFEWQRQTLAPDDIQDLHRRIERKRSGSPADEIAFYDATAAPRLLPVIYSQRYDYFAAVGPRVASRIGEAKTVLDFGCGVGILTTFYASGFPDIMFTGIDRSSASIDRANEAALERGLKNVQFVCLDLCPESTVGSFDLIVASHALLQAEQDTGVPSRDWTTFERVPGVLQREFEERTGLGPRLDQFRARLNTPGRLILFEKSRQLTRRVPLQRAMASRGLSLLEQPELIRYRLIEEVADDGPLYVVMNGKTAEIPWDEQPEPDEGRRLDFDNIRMQPAQDDVPLYENHFPSAQQAWEGLRGRTVKCETTRQEPDGRQVHVEFGTAEDLCYVYCSNTFDQRQLVIFHHSRIAILRSYYEEVVSGLA
ncbi:class I SAM-dependent methyltransferase [Nitrospira sp. KM1]|uniref:class I SAM-dependent methyltransferase n=1 Tax=Nitrospira sp. KM1 TaxID=1936990 RepID=UPI001563D53C|nr:methyltransferase domain-containing protein [Nitrospira sp. KM1]